jgi:D-alanine-D-alanine ligase
MTDRIVVLAGGLSPERDVSIRSGRRVAEALRHTGLAVEERDVDATLLPALLEDPPTCVIPLLHGATGEDGALRDVLESAGIVYVGSDPTACRLAFDKPIAKALLRAAGVHTPDSVALPHSTFRELGAGAVLRALESRLGFPVVVKPTKGGSSLGVSVVHSAADLPGAMVGCFAYGDTALLETFVDGVELAVSVVEEDGQAVALPPVEVAPDSGFYDYTARYTAGMTMFYVPARLPQETIEAAKEVARTVHTTLGLRHWSRSDLIVDADGTIWFLEVNVAPGQTETSTFPQAVHAAGRETGTLVASLVKDAISGAGR